MAGFVRRQEKKTRLATKGLPASSLSQIGLSSNEYNLVREASQNSEENEIVGVPISALPPAGTPNVADVVPGVQSGATKKFSLSSLFNWITGQITAASIGAVPSSRTVNGKALSSDITLLASDVSAIPTSEKGAANGIASLDSTGKVPSAQLPAIPTTAAGVSYDNTASGLAADDVQEAIDELAAGAGGGGVDPETIAPVEETTTAAVAHPLGSIFYLNGVLYRALSDIAVGGTINTAAGGNATQTTVAQNFKRTVTLTSAQYSQLSAAEKSADIVYILTDDNAISADDVDYDNTASGLTAMNVQDAIDEVYGDIPSQPSDIGAQAGITASGILKGDGTGGVSAAVAGTDYQAPLTAGTDYTTPAQLADKANQSQLAYVESGTTASRAYAVGEYFCWNGLLYRAKTAISSGASFTPGTNCEQVVGGGLNDIGISISTIAAVSGNTTIQIGGYYKIGYLVIFTVAIQASKNLVSGDNVCQGLPGVRANNIALRFYNHNSQTFGDAILVNTGVITLKSSVSNGQSIRLTGVYIA